MRRILLAEDDLEMLELVTEVLVRDGYEVNAVRDGGRLLVELSASARDERFYDLLVTDVRMPVCDGLQIVETLRRAGHVFPVVLMTAFGDAETSARAERAGAVLISKPFKIDQLRATIARLLG